MRLKVWLRGGTNGLRLNQERQNKRGRKLGRLDRFVGEDGAGRAARGGDRLGEPVAGGPWSGAGANVALGLLLSLRVKCSNVSAVAKRSLAVDARLSSKVRVRKINVMVPPWSVMMAELPK